LASKPALRRIIGHASSKRWACRAPDAAALLACGFLNTAASSGSAVREFFLFIGIGGWLGFIVLDGATYLLLALTLAVGLPLVQANAVKNAVAVPATIIAMLVFAFKGSIDWTLGAVMGAGSIAGGVLGARLVTSLQARKWVFWLLVAVISAELMHLIVHYVFKTY
jgi:uncharacterized protein